MDLSDYILDTVHQGGEFVLCRARHPTGAAWAVRPPALTHHQGRTILVREDPGGERGAQLDIAEALGRVLRSAMAAPPKMKAEQVIATAAKPASRTADAA